MLSLVSPDAVPIFEPEELLRSVCESIDSLPKRARIEISRDGDLIQFRVTTALITGTRAVPVNDIDALALRLPFVVLLQLGTLCRETVALIESEVQ